MDNMQLQEIIDEAKARGGGMVLNIGEKAAAVVLTIEKYNQLVENHKVVSLRQEAPKQPFQPGNILLPGEMEYIESDLYNEIEKDNNANILDDTKTAKVKTTVLVTGGAGYIGSHVARMLLKEGYNVVIVDDFSSGKKENLPQGSKLYEGNFGDMNFMRDLFARENINLVMHFGASVEVEESVREPEKYFINNFLNTANLLLAMQESGVKKIIFSSTAAVYGEEKNPIKETGRLDPKNPYGHSKLLAEESVKYFAKNGGFSAIIFRYFNACGVDPDFPVKPTHESHLLPKIIEAAKGVVPHITVFGNTYETTDGSCVRDYVHVLDIARAHILGLQILPRFSGKVEVYNIGTGKGRTVLEMVAAAAETLNRMVPMEIGEKRPGDPAILVADSSKIKSLGFETKYSDLGYIFKSAWKQV